MCSVRDLEISISPTDDFRASTMMRLLEQLGSSLDTLVLRFHRKSKGNLTGLPAQYQLANVPSGMFLPSLSAQSKSRFLLLPKLARLRILSQVNASETTAAGNLPSLLAHSSGLLEIDLSGAPVDLGTFMTAVEQLDSHRKSLEVLHLNLQKPRLASRNSTDVGDHWITIALDWLLDCGGMLPHLRDFSMSSFGGVEIIQENHWVSSPTSITISTLAQYPVDIMCGTEIPCPANQSEFSSTPISLASCCALLS